MTVMSQSNAVQPKAGVRNARCVVFAMASPDGICRSTLRKAARLAAGLDAEIELFYCAFDPAIIHAGQFHAQSPEEEIRGYMEQRQRELRVGVEDLRSTGVSVSARVEWENRPAEGIVREVLRRGAAFLVVESLSGRTDASLIESCPCPLLLIRSLKPYPSHPRIVAAVDPMHAHAAPAALDDAILTAAADVSRALGGELHLFHARVPWAAVSDQARGPGWVPDVAKDEEQVGYEHDVQSRVAELASRHGISDLHTHLVDGDVIECLPCFSSADTANIVAIGALSRSLLQRILVGDATRKLLDQLDCDVLAVKPPGFRSPVTVPES